MWARKIFPVRAAARDRRPGDRGRPRRRGRARRSPPAAPRAGRRVDALRLSGQARDERARTTEAAADGANPAELQLGHDCTVEQCTTLLAHLDAHWYQLPRRARDRGRETTVELCARRIGRRVLPRRRPHVRPQGPARPPVVPGHAASADARRAHRLRSQQGGRRAHWAWERWQGIYEWREACVVRASRRRSTAGISTSSSIVRDDERVRAGLRHARRARRRRRARAVAQALARRADGDRGAAALDDDGRGGADTGGDARRDARREARRSSLPPRTFNPGRVLRSIDAGPERRFRLTRLLQRGADFERVAFEETV